MSDDGWKPGRCPIAREQPHGYVHLHTKDCRNASPEQIESDRREVEARRLRLMRRIGGLFRRRSL